MPFYVPNIVRQTVDTEMNETCTLSSRSNSVLQKERQYYSQLCLTPTSTM